MSNARAVLGAGLVSLSLWDENQQQFSEFGDPVDADKFEIKPNFEEKTSTSKSHLDYGQARALVVLPSPTEITIEIAAANAAAFAMQFQGLVESISQLSQVSETKVFATQTLDEPMEIGHINIAENGLTVKLTGSPNTEYVLGTDYTIDYWKGTITFLGDGNVTGSDSITVTYNAGAVDGSKILGGRNPQVRCRAKFEGKNMVDGARLEVDVHEAVLGASNAFDFLSSDFVAIQLTGKIVTPAGKTEGYEVRLY